MAKRSISGRKRTIQTSTKPGGLSRRFDHNATSRQSCRKGEVHMVVVRNVFQLKFGKSREAIAMMKDGLAIQNRILAGAGFSTRVLTDAVGRFYTMVLEVTAPNLAAVESNMPRIFADKEWQAHYQKMSDLVESGYREVFNIVE
jgi:hypothetical protein